MTTLVIIPTYNEAENIAWIVAEVLAHQPELDILIADDASPDGTGDIADRLAAADHRLHVLHRGGKLGLGSAYRAGFAWGLERGYDTLVEMDADGSHRAEDLGRLLEASAAGADLVLGSRWVPGGGVVNWPWHRRFISRGGTFYAQMMLGIPVKDATGGFRAFRRETLERLPLDDVASQGYCFQIDMARRVLQEGMSIVEVPITFVERVRGQSKMSGDIVREALWRVTVWGLQRLVPKRLRTRRRQCRARKRPRPKVGVFSLALGRLLCRSCLLGGGRLLGNGCLLGGPMQVRRTDLAPAKQLKPLSQDFLELVDGATFEQHVPVRTNRLLVLDERLATFDTVTDLTGLGVFPLIWDVGLVGHRHREGVPISADVLHLLTGSHFYAALVLKALCPESSASQCTFCHGSPLSCSLILPT